MNTTATETGDRFLLANYEIPLRLNDKNEPIRDAGCPKDLKQADPSHPEKSPQALRSDRLPAASFLQVFAEPCPGSKQKLADLRLNTAARLSASFTYVSPATRLEPSYARFGYHFVDGGYYDNDGTGSVIEFLDSIDHAHAFPSVPPNEDQTPKKIQPILLIEIRNGNDVPSDRSPDSYDCQINHCTTDAQPSAWGPWRQFGAPAQAMYLAGHESVTRRNRRELCLLEERLASQGIIVHHVVFPIDDKNAALSWHLTSTQIADIRQMSPSQSAPEDTKNQKTPLTEAVGWFKAASSNPESAKETTDTCEVYPNTAK